MNAKQLRSKTAEHATLDTLSTEKALCSDLSSLIMTPILLNSRNTETLDIYLLSGPCFA